MVAIAPRLARAEACFGVAAIGVSAVVAVRFPIVKRTRLRIAIAVFVATSVRLPFHFPSPRSLVGRSEEHTSELQSLMRITYAVFCLKKKKRTNITKRNNPY